jgi:hypothetical protein
MHSSEKISLIPLLVLAFITAACSSGGPGGNGDGGTLPGSLTYWNDIAPLINDKCVKCHQAGGIGPFPLDNYEVVKLMAPTIAGVTKVNYMPPYLMTHDGSCGQFEDGDALSPEQIARLEAWSKGDRLEGTRVTITRPSIPGITDGDAYTSPMTAPRAQGTGVAMNDEYRCFPLGSKRADDAYITAYEVRPGNQLLVHHVIAFLVDPDKKTRDGRTNAEVMKALDDKDLDRPGWPCFGLAGEGVEVDAIPAIWAPGQGPVTYPGKVGVRHRKTEQVIMQIHYNLADPRVAGMSDSTTVQFRYATTVERRAVFVVEDPFLDTLQKPQPDTLPPGLMETTYTWTRTGAQLGIPPLAGINMLGLMPHMHGRGVREQLTLGPGAGTCAAQVKQWNFGWQKFYFYKGAPPTLTADTPIKLACTYNTMGDTMPVLPGWGTGNEMCTAILMVALPPGS